MPKSGALIKIRRQIGYIFQSHNLLDSLTISQNVQMAMRFNKTKRGNTSKRRFRMCWSVWVLVNISTNTPVRFLAARSSEPVLPEHW